MTTLTMPRAAPAQSDFAGSTMPVGDSMPAKRTDASAASWRAHAASTPRGSSPGSAPERPQVRPCCWATRPSTMHAAVFGSVNDLPGAASGRPDAIMLTDAVTLAHHRRGSAQEGRGCRACHKWPRISRRRKPSAPRQGAFGDGSKTTDGKGPKEPVLRLTTSGQHHGAVCADPSRWRSVFIRNRSTASSPCNKSKSHSQPATGLFALLNQKNPVRRRRVRAPVAGGRWLRSRH